jgi:phospholipase/carboxylesterase
MGYGGRMRRVRLADLDVVLAGGPDGHGGGDGPLVVLMHGFGAPGTDLVSLAPEVPVGKEVRFAFPAAPHAAQAGRAWWFIDMLELQQALMLRDYETLMNRTPAGLPEVRQQVGALLDALETELGAERKRTVLGGFSQGAMLATDVALRAEKPPGALAILSGSLICQREWLPLMRARADMPVLQSHGRGDPILAYEVAERLRDSLKQAGIFVDFIPFNGGHGIPEAALAGLARLIARVTA